MTKSAKKSIETLMKQGLLWNAQYPKQFREAAKLSAETEIHSLSTKISEAEKFKGNSLDKTKVEQLISAPFGIKAIDHLLPEYGLPCGFTHEFMLSNALSSQARYQWQAPLIVMTTLVRNAYELYANNAFIFWIGRKCWPSPHLLRKIFYPIEEREWAKLCIFIDPPSKDMRIWSIVQTLRSPSSFAVVADASNLSTTASRQLQLAAKGREVFSFFARPPWEEKSISTAQTRWKLCSKSSLLSDRSDNNGISDTGSERRQKRYKASLDKLSWSLELIRIKGSSIRTNPSSNSGNTSLFHDEERYGQVQNKLKQWSINWSIAPEENITQYSISENSALKEPQNKFPGKSNGCSGKENSLRLTLSEEEAKDGAPIRRARA